MARRDAARIEREKRIQAALADFFHAQGEVERIQVEAETAAAPFEASIREAVLTLDGLGETRSGIAELTGLSLAHVRQYITEVGHDRPHSEASASTTDTAEASP